MEPGGRASALAPTPSSAVTEPGSLTVPPCSALGPLGRGELNIICSAFWQSQFLASVPGALGSYRHVGLAAERTRARSSSSRDTQDWGQLAAAVFWPSCSDRPGRAWVRVVRELELFLLTLRSQRSSGQLSPLPEPLLSSPGEERMLQQACPAMDPEPGPRAQPPAMGASRAPPGPVKA